MTRGELLLVWARARIRQALGGPIAIAPDAPWATERAATFVTLRWRDGALQGCIGSLEAEREILADVAHNAIAAATRDPRTEPVVLAELDELDVEVSILSPLEMIGSEGEIRVGTDGVVLEVRGQRATFLPVMWKQLATLDTFMRELRHKAGLPRDAAPGDIQLWRYTVERHVDKAQ